MIGANNPFNIRYNAFNRWIGLVGETKGFCDFDTLIHGVRAAAYLVCKSYRLKGIVTIRDIISRFAPSSENQTVHYIYYVSNRCNLLSDVVLSESDYIILLRFMAFYESNFELSESFIKYIIDRFKLFNN